MEAIILDNEQLMIDKLESFVRKIGGVDIIGTFTSPSRALEAILEERPNIAFLEIDMGILSGLEIAEIVKDEYPDIHIVFITAYQDYAVQAFDLDAVDYLIKPIRLERLRTTIDRIIRIEQKETNNVQVEQNDNSPVVSCFGCIEFKLREAEEYSTIKWRTKKTQELFAYLLHNHNKAVRKDTLIDVLWPHVEWDQGTSLLYSAVYQIRKTFEENGLNIQIESAENTYRLLMNDVKVEVEDWERDLELFDPLTQGNINIYISVLKRYKGDYLGEYMYPWSEIEKKRLRALWLFHTDRAGEYLINNNDFITAIQLYHYVQATYPEGEASYFSLMKLYDKINDSKSVSTQYEALERILDDEFGIEVSSVIKEWYSSWKAGHLMEK